MNEGVMQVLIEFDNGQTSWFDIGPRIFVTRGGRPVASNTIVNGDRIRLLVNYAIVGPGHVMESVLEVSLENPGHHISTVLTGNLSGINPLQQQLMLRDARPLTNTGWGHHTQIQELSIASREIELFHNNSRITMEHAQRFLSRSDLVTYVALDSSPFGQSIRQITFRDGRDELLGSATVTSVNGNGGFTVGAINGTITTDAGTIVRRNGRMVTGNDIVPGDTVRVSLNGGNHAAVVDIYERPAVSGVSIARARIASIDEGRSFTVQSMSTLRGQDWMFTPIERTFTITPQTMFLSEGGVMSHFGFIDYTDGGFMDEVVTIVYDGSVATHVVFAPHPNRSVRGTVISGGFIRNAQVLDNVPPNPTYEWRDISRTNPTMDIIIPHNAIVVRNNRVVGAGEIQPGDQIRALIHGLPEDIEPGMEVRGLIVLVEG